LLSQARSTTPKYQAMNGLAERALWLALEAWADDPVPLILFENVPRLLSARGRRFADQLGAMLRSYGYASRETVHDCGKLGGLAQTRKRCLIVARHPSKVPNFLYEPPQRALRPVGDVLSKLWLPGDAAAGPMHRVPQLQWKTWVRLAMIEAGSDWRSLNRLEVHDGRLRDYLIVPADTQAWHPNVLGVNRWDAPVGTVTSEARPTTGRFAVADPRYAGALRNGPLGVTCWGDSAGTVAGENRATNGAFSVADPRFEQSDRWNDGHAYGVRSWSDPSATITAKLAPGSRSGFGGKAKYIVTPYDAAANTVIAASTTGNGAFAVADPRPAGLEDRAAYVSAGHYGVVPWSEHAGTVSAAACHDNGRWSVADPRPQEQRVGDPRLQLAGEAVVLPEASSQLVAHIQSLDGTWHRPFTTLELAALQSLFDPDDPADVAAFTDAFCGASISDSGHREWIGNAVPPDSAEAIAEEMLRTLLLADAGETFKLSATPVWVRPVIAGLALASAEGPAD
jgi:site-specific DNA-cytosine methylase